MKTILCYGDSNTFGYIPGSEGGRYDHKTRWPCVLGELLNKSCPPGEPDWWLVEEGLNGRTLCLDDPFEPGRNGLAYVIPILKSHKPIDLVVLMLGTNDTKRRFNPSPYDISEGLELIVKAILHSEAGPGEGAPEVLVVCPPHIVPEQGRFFDDLFDGSIEVSKKLAPYYLNVAKRRGVEFFDAAKAIKSSTIDGIHLEAGEHKKLAEALSKIIPEIFKDSKL